MVEIKEKQPIQELEVEPHSVAVATTTFYPRWYPGEIQDHDLTDKVRGDLALKLIKEAAGKGYQIALVDGGSSQEFLSEVGLMNVVVRPELERGMSASRRQAFEAARILKGVKVICWTEPEKISIIRDCLPNAVLPILNGEADIVVPARNDLSFQSYPDYQAEEEKRANREWNAILKARGFLPKDDPDLDVWFGPKFFRNAPEILRLFLDKYEFRKRDLPLDKIIDPELWPNATFLPIVAALHRGFQVKSVPVPYIHPKEQTEIEINNPLFVRKRDIQRKNIIVNTIHFIKMLQNNQRGRMELSGKS